VATYEQGLAALKVGSAMRYDGAGGPTHFDKWNNSNNGFVVVRYNANGDEETVGSLTNAQITQLSAP